MSSYGTSRTPYGTSMTIYETRGVTPTQYFMVYVVRGVRLVLNSTIVKTTFCLFVVVVVVFPLLSHVNV
jgi:hypothetical protein